MAIAIKHIPTLKGDEALAFQQMVDENYRDKKHSIDFTREVKKARRIIEKSIKAQSK